MKENILYSSEEICLKIKQLFDNPEPDDRRVALVAYVGRKAVNYLKCPSGIYLVCNPAPGITDHSAIQDLLTIGVKVEFSNKLHMKVYWSEKRGCVITSANLSTGALEPGNLEEAGVYLPPGVVDIDRLIQNVSPKQITDEAMDALDRASRRITTKLGEDDNRIKLRENRNRRPFMIWEKTPYRQNWKLFFWYIEDEISKKTLSKCRNEYNKSLPEVCLSTSNGKFSNDDWILTVKPSNKRYKCDWVYVDFVTHLDESDDVYCEDHSYEVVQVHNSEYYPRPPFIITPEFEKAFYRAAKKYKDVKSEDINDVVNNQEIPSPPELFLDMIRSEMIKISSKLIQRVKNKKDVL